MTLSHSMTTARHWLWLTVVLAALTLPSLTFAQTVAGAVETVKGSATAAQSGQSARTLKQGDQIFQGDAIKTGADSAVRVRFLDDTTFDVGEKTSATIDEFVFDANSAAAGKLTAGVLTGSFRFVTGKIGKAKPENVSVRTPVATIGVRGTRFAGQTDGGTAEVVLLAEANQQKSAILVANNAGSVIIAQAGFGTTVAGPNIAPAPPQSWQQNRINRVTRSITRSLPRLRMPNVPRTPRRPGVP